MTGFIGACFCILREALTLGRQIERLRLRQEYMLKRLGDVEARMAEFDVGEEKVVR
jgi:hypothetical protein